VSFPGLHAVAGDELLHDLGGFDLIEKGRPRRVVSGLEGVVAGREGTRLLMGKR
jgi:hypothetical protein